MSGDDGTREDPGIAVYQAQGMISAQVACTMDEALLLMRARARTGGQTLDYVASAVVGGDIRFD